MPFKIYDHGNDLSHGGRTIVILRKPIEVSGRKGWQKKPFRVSALEQVADVLQVKAAFIVGTTVGAFLTNLVEKFHFFIIDKIVVLIKFQAGIYHCFYWS